MNRQLVGVVIGTSLGFLFNLAVGLSVQAAAGIFVAGTLICAAGVLILNELTNR